MALTFHTYEPHEKHDLLAMMCAFYEIDGYPFDRERASKNIDLFSNDRSLGRLFMISEEGEIVGYVALTFGFSFEYGGRDAFLDELYVKEEFRNRGVGRAALKFLESKCQEHDVKALHLEVERHNERANKLYLEHGFRSKDRYLLTRLFGTGSES